MGSYLELVREIKEEVPFLGIGRIKRLISEVEDYLWQNVVGIAQEAFVEFDIADGTTSVTDSSLTRLLKIKRLQYKADSEDDYHEIKLYPLWRKYEWEGESANQIEAVFFDGTNLLVRPESNEDGTLVLYGVFRDADLEESDDSSSSKLLLNAGFYLLKYSVALRVSKTPEETGRFAGLVRSEERKVREAITQFRNTGNYRIDSRRWF